VAGARVERHHSARERGGQPRADADDARDVQLAADDRGMRGGAADLGEHGAGGATSHAALVTRELGKPGVVGCGVGSLTQLAGQLVTVDGSSGRVFAGEVDFELAEAQPDEHAELLVEWAQARVPVKVLNRADAATTPRFDEPLPFAAEVQRLAGHTSAGGTALETRDGLRAALAAGLQSVIVEHPLAVLLQLAQILSEHEAPAAPSGPGEPA
jgi:pyruvate,orthophosphate dikinase